MEKPKWDPFSQWRPAKIDWIKVDIAKEDLQKFMQRSNLKGLFQMISFLLIIAITAAFAYYTHATGKWLLLALALYLHGMLYSYIGSGIHELTHNTVFKSKSLNMAAAALFGLIYWPSNPFFYRLSHIYFHHQYTLYQNSDGEETPIYIDLSAKSVFFAFFRVLQIKTFIQCTFRLLTLKPPSKGWRMRGFKLDTWEEFVLQKGTDIERKRVRRMSIAALIYVLLFTALSIISGHWFLIVLFILAPFYGPTIHFMIVGAHMHACCQPNNPDFRLSCGDVKLDPISSTLYWHMEYHIEHHMFPSVPCYNLKKFHKFTADQMPRRESALPLFIKLGRKSKDMYGSWEEWRKNYGYYKGL